MNKIVNWVTGLGNLWDKAHNFLWVLTGAAGVLGGGSTVLLEAAKLVSGKNTQGLLELVKHWQSDPGIVALLGGLAVLKTHAIHQDLKPQSQEDQAGSPPVGPTAP